MSTRGRTRVNLFIFKERFYDQPTKGIHPRAEYKFFSDDHCFDVVEEYNGHKESYFYEYNQFGHESLKKEYKTYGEDIMTACYREKIPFWNENKVWGELMWPPDLILIATSLPGLFVSSVLTFVLCLSVIVCIVLGILYRTLLAYFKWKSRWRSRT